jgi:phage virion morphogenesis protein
MFAKLRTAKYLKVKGNSDGAAVQFTDSMQRMARVYHCCLRDRPARGGKEVQYEARPLLGLNDDFESMVSNLVIEAIQGIRSS